MIVAETAEGFQFVTQPDHAALAGQFADHWGTDRFEQPDPRAAVLLATYNHDVGWWEYDRRPHLADGEPVDFRGTASETWIDLYEDGIRTVAEMDPYAGLLVSLHGAGLRRRRYGLSPSWTDTPREYTSFVRRQEALQTRLLDDLQATDRYPVSAADEELLSTLHQSGEAPAGSESRLWCNYRLLQAWDTLSLSFCLSATPPGHSTVDPVPTSADGDDEELSITGLGDGEFLLEPYPFDASPLVVSVPARTVREEQFDDEESLTRAYYRAERTLKEFTLRKRQ